MRCQLHRLLPAIAMAGCLLPAPGAAQAPAAGGALPPVTISGKALRDPVEKSYRRMVRGMDLFEANRGAMAPEATLRFKLLPRKPGTDLNNLDLHVLGSTAEIPVPVAADQTFTLPRDARAIAENAQVTPDRKALTMTWRADIRTPGLPPHTRRLGDLRLECLVGMEAGLISNSPSFIAQLFGAPSNTPAYCSTKDNRYLFFADRPLFGVTLVSGTRRESVRIDRLYASAIDDPNLRNELPYCDCEMLLDRTYFLPLEDASWPHDTLVEFDFIDEAGAAAATAPGPVTLGSEKADVLARRGPAEQVRFDNGWEVWAWRDKRGRDPAAWSELVVLFSPCGLAQKTRLRPGVSEWRKPAPRAP